MKPNKILLILTAIFTVVGAYFLYLTWSGEISQELNNSLSYANQIISKIFADRDNLKTEILVIISLEYPLIFGKFLFARILSLLFFIGSLGGLIEVCISPLRCKKCKKNFALRKISTHCTGSKKISVLVETNSRSAYSGQVVNRTEQYIPGTREFFEVTYKCKYCGSKQYVNYSVDSADV